MSESPFARRGHRMEKCLFMKKELELPDTLLEDLNVFREVVSAQTWNESLTDSQRQHLMKFLPTYPENDAEEKEKTLAHLFAAKTFKFTSPLRSFHKKLKEGMFSPAISKYISLIKRARHKEYIYQQQVYYSNLVKEILISRQRLLDEHVNMLAPDEPLKLNHKKYQPSTAALQQQSGVHYRMKRKYRKIVKEINEECGLDDTSSEDEDKPSCVKGRKQLLKLAGNHDSPAELPAMSVVQGTFATKPIVTNGEAAAATTSGQKAAALESGFVEVTEENLMEMLRKHRKRRAEAEEHPELDTADITLEDILSRTHPGKKTVKASAPSGAHPTASKKKSKETSEKRKRVKSESGDAGLAASGEDGVADDSGTEEGTAEHTSTSRTVVGHSAHFFSLIRDLISEDPEQRITTMKLEEKVREWQESPLSAALNDWFTEQSQWIDLVLSALKFLSGNVLGLSLDNFVPYLDYKERAQQWKWIGQGRDSDEQLAQFCQHWLQNKDDLSLDPTADAAGTPPPARSKTQYIVRSTTEEEKIVFRDQEQERFTNPHKAFTYSMHGYESVVGPVKGVYNRDSAMNKAREHALLVSDRPAFVTILTLVRDAAARLPNGEGTRSDICELLKDSQFLAPCVTDAQVNTVVSGALDRLHYEKDPCVKYDVNRKLWIYLHRCRTESEFEKIHQAQGAAAKARKALQKPKPTKKIKETVVMQQASAVPAVSVPMADDMPSSVPSVQTPEVVLACPKSSATMAVTSPRSGHPRVHSPKTSSGGGIKAGLLPAGITMTPLQPGVRVSGVLPPGVGLLQPAVGSGGRAVQLTGPRTRVGQPGIAQLSPTGKPMGVSFVQPSSKGVLTPIVAPSLLTAGGTSKPVAFSLIQSQEGSPNAPSSSGVPSQPQTVVLTTTNADGQKIIAAMQPGSGQAGVRMAHGVRFGRPPVSSTVGASPRGGGVARFIQQLPLTQQPTAKMAAAMPTQKQSPTTIKIQGGIMAQSMPRKPVAGATPVTFQKTTCIDTKASAANTASLDSAAIASPGTKTIGQMTMGGKPATFLLTKSGARPASGKPGGGPPSVVQLLQTSNQPMLGAARPILIGGKPLHIGGKPYQLVGKPPGGATTQAGYTSAAPTAVNIVTQPSEQGGMLSSSAGQPTSGHPSTGQLSAQPSASLVSQILQAGTMQQLLSSVKTVTMATTGGSSGRGQARVASTAASSPGSIVVTQLPQGFTAKAATSISSQARMVAVSQGGLLPNQILVQPNQNQAKVITPQQLFAGARVRPGFLTTQSGKAGIQMIKTVLSQPTGGKPAQTTILLAQPASQSPSTLVPSADPHRGEATRPKSAPVYARIIAPTAGLRLAAMRPAQAPARPTDSVPVMTTLAKPTAAKTDEPK